MRYRKLLKKWEKSHVVTTHFQLLLQNQWVAPFLRVNIRLSEQIAEVEAERRAQLQTSSETSIDKVRQLMQLKGIGINGAWLLVMAFFGWRAFTNRREVGGLAGFTPTPYQSGERAREQGITKSGNRHVRWMTTELAWSWLRFQPDSALSVWFRERFGGGGTRLRRIGIVAVGRKLLISLSRFLETGGFSERAEPKEQAGHARLLTRAERAMR